MKRLDHIDTWVFDLDNTLYPAKSHIFPQMIARMDHYIEHRLDLSFDQARRLKTGYFHDYGTVLRGLMPDHGSDPLDFLNYVHDIDLSAILPAPGLARNLSCLPGRKLVFTNGLATYAEQILNRLGMRPLFEDIFDIIQADYYPKPERQPYHRLVERHDLDPGRTIFFEDVRRNLIPAADLGMTTVWVRRDPDEGEDGHEADKIHHVTGNLETWIEEFLRQHSLFSLRPSLTEPPL